MKKKMWSVGKLWSKSDACMRLDRIQFIFIFNVIVQPEKNRHYLAQKRYIWLNYYEMW